MFQVIGGMDINEAIEKAKASVCDNQTVTFQFNGVAVTVDKSSDVQLLAKDFFLAFDGDIEKKIGPEPSGFYSK